MATIEYHHDIAEYSGGVRELLALTEDEFHPPLSGREGTTQTSGLNEEQNDALDDYLKDLLDQQFVLALNDGVVGFLSFRQDYTAEPISQYSPSEYVSTVAVHPEERRQGYAQQMYHTLLTDLPEDIYNSYVTTRTWSTNYSHLNLLDELGFKNVATIPNDRGEDVDTVYYAIAYDAYEQA